MNRPQLRLLPISSFVTAILIGATASCRDKSRAPSGADQWVTVAEPSDASSQAETQAGSSEVGAVDGSMAEKEIPQSADSILNEIRETQKEVARNREQAVAEFVSNPSSDPAKVALVGAYFPGMGLGASDLRRGGSVGEGLQTLPKMGASKDAPPQDRVAARRAAAADGNGWRRSGVGLNVVLPESASKPLSIRTRGLEFSIQPVGVDASAVRFSSGAAFYGENRLMVLEGAPEGAPLQGQEGSRLEEFVILPDGAGNQTFQYEVTVPKSVTSIHKADGYLEFLNEKGISVLRLHQAVAADVSGARRNGDIRLKGVGRPEESGRYSLAGDTLGVATTVNLAGLSAPIVVDPGWSSTGSMATARMFHSATLLPSGKVLVAGGFNGVNQDLNSTEVYDRDTETWSASGSLALAREQHTASLLTTGNVLVAGGFSSTSLSFLTHTELYDPATGTWSVAGPMGTPRMQHTATVLSSGEVLVAGGRIAHPPVIASSAEIYDPIGATWRSAIPMGSQRYLHIAFLLHSGEVLVGGGWGGGAYLASCELYNPNSDSWRYTGSMSIARTYHAGAVMADGRVIVAGGGGSADVEIYDPAIGNWLLGTPMLDRRDFHTLHRLRSGRVLVVGGGDRSGGQVLSAELFDPVAAKWVRTEPMVDRRLYHASVLLPSGHVLVAGGFYTWGFPLNSAEIYDEGGAPPTPNQPPVAEAGADGSAECSSSSGALVSLDGSGSTDPDSTVGTNDDIVSFEWFEGTTSIATGETASVTLPLGTHTITLKVTDSGGLSDTDEVVVTVQDTTAPTLSASVSPGSLWPPSHKMVEIVPAFTVSDACDPKPSVIVLSATSNEPDNGLGDGDTEGDIQITGGQLFLRAERSGTGTGRIYTLTFRATDASGNSATSTATVTVPHDQGQGAGQGQGNPPPSPGNSQGKGKN